MLASATLRTMSMSRKAMKVTPLFFFWLLSFFWYQVVSLISAPVMFRRRVINRPCKPMLGILDSTYCHSQTPRFPPADHRKVVPVRVQSWWKFISEVWGRKEHQMPVLWVVHAARNVYLTGILHELFAHNDQLRECLSTYSCLSISVDEEIMAKCNFRCLKRYFFVIKHLKRWPIS